MNPYTWPSQIRAAVIAWAEKVGIALEIEDDETTEG